MPSTRVTFGPTQGRQVQAIDPAMLAASAGTATAPNPSMLLQQLQSIPTSNPVFANEAQRNIAINTGAFDPTFASPLQKTLANSISLDRSNTQDALIKSQQEEHPLKGASTPQDILAAQLAADKDGTIKKIIIKNQPTPLRNDPTEIVPNDQLHPYIGHVAPNAHGDSAYAPLDFNLIHDPDFAKAYQKDPKEGMRIYKAMTGRELVDDTKNTHDIVATHQAKELNTYETNMANGSIRDKTTGGWKIRQARELDPTGAMMGGMTGAKPSEFRDATPYENQLMDRYYQQYVGPFDKQPSFTPLVQRNAAAVKQRTALDPVLGKLITDKEKALGRSLDPMEMIRTAAEHDQQTAAQDAVSNPASIAGGWINTGPNTTKGLGLLQSLGQLLMGKKAGIEGEQGANNVIRKNFLAPLPEEDLNLP